MTGLKVNGNTLEKAEPQTSCLGTHGLLDSQTRTVRPEAFPLTGNHCAPTLELHSFQSSSRTCPQQSPQPALIGEKQGARTQGQLFPYSPRRSRPAVRPSSTQQHANSQPLGLSVFIHSGCCSFSFYPVSC